MKIVDFPLNFTYPSWYQLGSSLRSKVINKEDSPRCSSLLPRNWPSLALLLLGHCPMPSGKSALNFILGCIVVYAALAAVSPPRLEVKLSPRWKMRRRRYRAWATFQGWPLQGNLFIWKENEFLSLIENLSELFVKSLSCLSPKAGHCVCSHRSMSPPGHAIFGLRWLCITKDLAPQISKAVYLAGNMESCKDWWGGLALWVGTLTAQIWKLEMKRNLLALRCFPL